VWRTQSKHFSYAIDVFPIIELVAGNSHISLQLLTRNLFVHFVRPLPKSKRNAWQAADSSCWTQTPKWSSILRYSDSQILRYSDTHFTKVRYHGYGRERDGTTAKDRDGESEVRGKHSINKRHHLDVASSGCGCGCEVLKWTTNTKYTEHRATIGCKYLHSLSL